MKRSEYLVIALLSITLVGLEMIWTRIFSAEFFYTFAFLTLSLAVMGLGMGALALRLIPGLSRGYWLSLSLIICSGLAVAGPPLVFALGLDFSVLFSSVSMVGLFLIAVLLLSGTFFFGGIALSFLFRYRHEQMPRLYMADLIGAAAGVVAAVLLMNIIQTPYAAFVIVLPTLIAAIITCRKALKVFPAILALVVILLTPYAPDLLEREVQERAPVIYKHWDAISKIKMYDFGGYYRGLNIDNVANSPVIPFDGDWSVYDTTDESWDIDVGYLVDRFDSCVFLSLGAGGGMDVFQAIEQGATEIHAVEVNGHINDMMLHGDSPGYIDTFSVVREEPEINVPDSSDHISDSALSADSAAIPATPPPPPPPQLRDPTGKIITLAEYSGGLYLDPRVRVVTEDARTYVRRFRSKFDIIYSVSSNTWAALGSGSFALAENYIFTTEAFEDYWRALSDSGFLSMEHQVYMPRLVSEVITALENQGVAEPRDHFAIYALPNMRRKLLLLSRQPLTDSLRYYAYGPLTPERYQDIHLLYPRPDTAEENVYDLIVRDGWRSIQDTIAVDLSPADDNRPFVAQMGMWKNLTSDKLDKINLYAEFTGFPLSTLTIVIIVAVVLVLLVPLNLVPFIFSREKMRAAPWLYFFAIGAGFMMIEVVLIQQYALFIGASVYSIATVLLTLLLASGIGSRFSWRISSKIVFPGILIWLVLDVLLFENIAAGLAVLPVIARVSVSALIVAPLGFFMGMPFPKATRRVGELIDWGFAINGAASMLGSTLVVLVAILYGFNIALLLAGGCYLIAFGLYRARSAW
ncbi:MAG TPA: hypothetical protein PLF13_05000 [candidate division Zixibacteria bacterium]|nr:hypothetical protein [candidate division Zixibacteria bacterium]